MQQLEAMNEEDVGDFVIQHKTFDRRSSNVIGRLASDFQVALRELK
jgi:hypothetical protein